jgi:hypothetical protein
MNNLPLQIGNINPVVINNSYCTSSGKVEQDGRAEPVCACNEHPCLAYAFLSFDANFVN